MFSKLQDMKRGPDNAAFAARRQSVTDQGQKQGVFGTMYNK